jgi:tetratricopeptide (TPR) repeat protein
MYNILISLAIGLISGALVALTPLGLWGGAVVFLLVTVAAIFVATRIVMKKVAAIMEIVQKDLQANRPEKAIKVLESALVYSRWQFYLKGQIRSHIGMIHFLRRDFATAFEFLKDGFIRNWPAMGMLAVTYMKKNKPSLMTDAFEKAVAANKKEPMLWNLYAYCLEETGQHGKAIEVMEKGLKKAGANDILKANLALLREGKKMKMMEWGELWYQFHLEKTGNLVKEQTRAMQGRRKMPMR